MEQYIHTLIPTDPAFVPAPSQIASFFDSLVTDFNFQAFQVIPHPRRHIPGLWVVKPTGLFKQVINPRTGEVVTNPRTGEALSRPENQSLNPGKFADIPPLIEGLGHYRVTQKGEWKQEDRPVKLLNTNRTPHESSYLCDVSCELRRQPVSMSAWDVEAGPNIRNVPQFGSPCEAENKIGIFPNPWTGEVIEVANAGCARFWIEFEFGRFIYPDVTNRLDVFRPSIILKTEECFQTKIVQGCRFW